MIASIVLVALHFTAAGELYVSPKGLDSNPGSQSKPLATLSVAIDRARRTKATAILLSSGTYRQTESLKLDQRDNGLTIRSVDGTMPKLTGGFVIPQASVKQCEDSSVLSKIIDRSARFKVKVVDLKALGLETIAAIKPRGFPHGIDPAPNELFIGGKVMTLARWPNEGYTKVATVLEPGNGENDRDKPPRKPVFTGVEDRSKQWSHAKDLWLYGYWKYAWADETIAVDQVDSQTGTITLSNPHIYGVDTGVPFYAENLIEELDQPGEYWIDKKTMQLYFIPRPNLAGAPIEFSTQSPPLVAISNASRITFRGIDFCLSRGDGASVSGSEQVRFEGCHFYNLGNRAVVIEGGHDCGLQSCDIWETGDGGVSLNGGDRNTLTPARNFVDNCDIHHYQRRNQTYRPAVVLYGVGNRVSHCDMHDSPHSAIIFSGNDHIIEFNEIFRTISRTGDGGVIYTGRDWTARGTEIRSNYIHDNIGISKWEPAIYIDDMGSGIHVHDNIIKACHRGFLIGGGRDNIVENNLISDCVQAFSCDARGLGWGASMLPTLTERLNAVPYDKEPWKSCYPSLVPILGSTPLAPMGNVIADNLIVRSGKLLKDMEDGFRKSAKLQGNVETQEFSGSPRFSTTKMGLRVDQYRHSIMKK